MTTTNRWAYVDRFLTLDQRSMVAIETFFLKKRPLLCWSMSPKSASLPAGARRSDGLAAATSHKETGPRGQCCLRERTQPTFIAMQMNTPGDAAASAPPDGADAAALVAAGPGASPPDDAAA